MLEAVSSGRGGPTLSARAAARRLRVSVARVGLGLTVHDLLLRATNRFVLFKILRAMTVEQPRAEFQSCPPPYSATQLESDLLRHYCRRPDNDLTREFVDDALAKGDRCFGILLGESLAAYGWYSRRPTRIDPPELWLHPGDRYVYMYKGYTHPAHRGRRLNAIAMTFALRHYLAAGASGLLLYVESNNFNSLFSVARMGYRTFGTVYLVRIRGALLCRASAGCRAHGLRIAPTAADACAWTPPPPAGVSAPLRPDP